MPMARPSFLIVALNSLIPGGAVFYHFTQGRGWTDAHIEAETDNGSSS